ncbi:hypothetical protein ACFLTH_07230, partial [Bacteroidota bacterium]
YFPLFVYFYLRAWNKVTADKLPFIKSSFLIIVIPFVIGLISFLLVVIIGLVTGVNLFMFLN